MIRESDENCLSRNLWPARLQPKRDELLSSWLVRLSMAHGQKLHTFCSITWPKKSIWNRDIDKSADADIVRILSAKTATPIERVRAMTVAGYEGTLYEKHNRFGPTSWIMPIGVYHRKRVQYGLQYCPSCLAEDEAPYFRRKWRLAFITICEHHHRVLHDRCPICGAAVNFHRDELGNFRKFAPTSMTLCHSCNFDLRDVTKSNSSFRPVTVEEIAFTTRLTQLLNGEGHRIGNLSFTYAHLFFDGLRQIMKILGMRNKSIASLREVICDTYNVESYAPTNSRQRPDVQEQGISERRQLLGLTRFLIEEWPDRFITLAQKCGVWSSVWLRHLGSGSRGGSRTAPFWFWTIVREHLDRTRHCPSEQETRAAICYLRRRGEVVNKSSLARLLGVAVMRRAHFN